MKKKFSTFSWWFFYEEQEGRDQTKAHAAEDGKKALRSVCDSVGFRDGAEGGYDDILEPEDRCSECVKALAAIRAKRPFELRMRKKRKLWEVIGYYKTQSAAQSVGTRLFRQSREPYFKAEINDVTKSADESA